MSGAGDFPTTATPSELVGRVLGLNPGLMTGPGTNTYLVGRREPILIDTGAGVAAYIPLLERYLAARGYGPIARAVLTHRHPDHMGGVADLRARFPGLPVGKLIHRDPSLPAGVEPLAPDAPIAGDDATLVPVYTPGHASDHVCFYLPEERALFTGDVVLGGSTTVIPPDDGDLADYMASLRRLLELDVRRIYPAHGPVIEDGPGRIREYIAHREEREREVLAALADGLRTIPEMVARIYAAVSPSLHRAAGMSVESHLRKLAREGRVRETVVPDHPLGGLAGAPARWELVR